MKTVLLILIISAVLATTAIAGTITGTVRAEGKTGAEDTSGDDKYSSRKYKFAERVDYEAMRDFVVYIDGPVGTNAAPEKHVQVVTNKKISQRGALFSPHVLPIMAGTTVEWPNNDDIFHNVFSMSDPKQFDLGLYKSPEIKSVTFDKSGRVDVFCSIHSSMSCVVLVLQNPYFAATDEKGRYSITNVPPGTYTLKAWHERLPPQQTKIIVPKEGEVKTDFVLGIKNLPKY